MANENVVATELAKLPGGNQQTHRTREVLVDSILSVATLSRRYGPVSFTIAMDSLPDDVLARIFELCHVLTSKRGRIRLALRLTQVTCRWRAIVIDVSCLWTCLHFGNKTKLPPQSQLMNLLTWSKQRLLDITLINQSKDSDPNFISTVHSLVAHSDRWRRLSICVNSTLQVHRLVTLLSRVSVRRLEHLTLISFDEAFVWHGLLPPSIFTAGAPMLSSVMVQNTVFPVLSGLTHVRFSRIYVASGNEGHTQFTEMLRNVLRLENLQFSDICFGIFESVSNDLELPSLHSLTIRRVHGAVTADILQLLSVPALNSLTLDHALFDPSTDHIQSILYNLSPFQDRQYPELREFTCIQPYIKHLPPLNFIFGTPLVERVTIISDSADTFLQTLILHDTAWPHLQSLEISNYSADFLTGTVLYRNANGKPIQELKLSIESLGDSHFVEWLLERVKTVGEHRYSSLSGDSEDSEDSEDEEDDDKVIVRLLSV